ncbi:helix-turn-helix domain-containing protein [Sphingosinicella terrae]|uniref:helix-turn-helix domain-containing protein n=1 Tax=Sphingosinicella terrae TaxID=2172047 RepID=UPI000E0D3294|nr:helix-turn-helix domain-containing protein [Sphingosinicella terrae]
MSLGQADLAVRIGAITILLLLASLLFRQRRALGAPAWLFPPLALCLSGFLAGNTPEASLRPDGVAGAAANLASGFAVVFLWWFCLACFDTRFRLRGTVLAVGLLWAFMAAMDRGLFGSAAADIDWSYLLVVLGFAIVAHLVWRLVSERGGDLVQRRHDARILVAILLGGQLLVDLAADVLFGFAWRPIAFSSAQNLAILGFGVWLAARLLTIRTEAFSFGGIVGPPATTTPMIGADMFPEEDALRPRLRALIEEERVFLDSELTFAGFVERMGAPERIVRRLINHELGFDHFRTFLNHYRVAEARRRLRDPLRSGDKLIAVALDSGFASLASFNRVFRDMEGCAPSRFREAARVEGIDEAAGEKAPVPGFEQRSAMF